MAAQPSVAQAAMIGNPVSMPRVIQLERRYNDLSEKKNVFFKFFVFILLNPHTV